MAGRRFDSQTCTMAVLHSLQEMSGMERNHLHGQPDVWDALVFPTEGAPNPQRDTDKETNTGC